MSNLKIEYGETIISISGQQASAMWQLVVKGFENLDALPKTPDYSKLQGGDKKVAKTTKYVKRHTAKLWTQEEYDSIIARNNELVASGVKMRSQRVKILAKEFTQRTKTAILARLQEYDHGIPFKVKPHWKKAGQHQPEPEPHINTPVREFLTEQPHGSIKV